MCSGRAVQKWVQAEFDLFKKLLRMAITDCQVECLGNPIGQGIHDCGTLADKWPYLAVGLQFIMPGWTRNIAVALGMVRCVSKKDQYLADKIEVQIQELTGVGFMQVCKSMCDYQMLLPCLLL